MAYHTSPQTLNPLPCLQWFYFKVTGAKRRALEMNIINAGEASFPEAWPGTRAVASYDLDDWWVVALLCCMFCGWCVGGQDEHQ